MRRQCGKFYSNYYPPFPYLQKCGPRRRRPPSLRCFPICCLSPSSLCKEDLCISSASMEEAQNTPWLLSKDCHKMALKGFFLLVVSTRDKILTHPAAVRHAPGLYLRMRIIFITVLPAQHVYDVATMQWKLTMFQDGVALWGNYFNCANSLIASSPPPPSWQSSHKLTSHWTTSIKSQWLSMFAGIYTPFLYL